MTEAPAVFNLKRDNPYPLVTSIGEEQYFNFARLIQRYVRSFAKSDPSTALQYIYLIGLNGDLPSPAGEEQLEICWDTIVQLVIETKGYSLVLDQRTADGQIAVSIAIVAELQLLILISIILDTAERHRTGHQAGQDPRPRECSQESGYSTCKRRLCRSRSARSHPTLENGWKVRPDPTSAQLASGGFARATIQ